MRQKETVICVVQARMGSTRLPGKALMDVIGKPMLWHIADRLRYSRLIDRTIVATSTNSKDDAIEACCRQYGLQFYRGSEQDLVGRFYEAVRPYDARAIVRITADCPLVDPGIVDRLVNFYLENNGRYEYVSNARPQATYPHGLDAEVFSFSLLERLWGEVKDPFRMEWFTTVIFENPQKYKIFCIASPTDLSHIRLTVDYAEDLELVRFIYGKLYSPDLCFGLEDILRLRTQNPDVFDINRKYTRDEQYVQELKKRRLA